MASDTWCLSAFWSSVIYFAQRTYLEHSLIWAESQQQPIPRSHMLLPKCSITCCSLLRSITFCCYLTAAAKFSQAIVNKGPENIVLVLGRGLCSPALTLTFKSEKSRFITITVISTP